MFLGIEGRRFVTDEHVSDDENNAGLFTKHLPRFTFEKHVQMYYGIDKYKKQGKVIKVTWNLPSS